MPRMFIIHQCILYILQADEDDITCDPRESFIDVHNHPLVVQGLKSSISDPDAHVLLFDTEALIVQLLCDEFGISPAALKENYRQSQAGEAGQKPSGEFEQKVNGNYEGRYTHCQDL